MFSGQDSEMEILLPQLDEEANRSQANPEQLSIANEYCTPQDWHHWCLFAAQGTCAIALVCGVLVGLSLPVLIIVVAPDTFENEDISKVFAKSVLICTAVFTAAAALPSLACCGTSFFCNRRVSPIVPSEELTISNLSLD